MSDEVLDQQGNILSSFPQRRNLNRENVETIKPGATGARSRMALKTNAAVSHLKGSVPVHIS
jgi:hypothetical protein